MKTAHDTLENLRAAAAHALRQPRPSRRGGTRADLTQLALCMGRSLALGEAAQPSLIENPRRACIDVVDLFSGCGGLSAGFRMFTAHVPVYRTGAALDLDTDANETYWVNLGVEPHRSDAHQIAADTAAWNGFLSKLDLKEGNLTVVVGGPPCQGFSSHRKTIKDCEGLNVLLPDFARIAVRLDPAAVLMENVPELLTDRSWPFYSEAVGILKAAGYLVRTRIYNFACLGLPQERFRSVTLAMKKPFAMPAPLLQRDDFRTVRQTIGHLPRIGPGRANVEDRDHARPAHRPSTLATIQAIPKDGGRRPLHVGPECLRALAARNGRTGYDDVYGRLWWDRPAVTVTAYARNPASGRFLHPTQNRGLSVREAALLQGFPAHYQFFGSFDSRFIQVGNSVPPSVAAYFAAHILAELVTDRDEMPGLEGDIIRSVGTSFSRLIAGIKRGYIQV
jgi:DNA (cytosine-5)-methyltransferase 1